MTDLMKALLEEVLWDYINSNDQTLDIECAKGNHIEPVKYKNYPICRNCGILETRPIKSKYYVKNEKENSK